jgi:hypothetical protein
MNDNTMKPFISIVKQFNEEVEEGIKHLIGTTGIIDPYDVEEGKLTVNEAQAELESNGWKIIYLRNPLDATNVDLLLFEKDKFIAGVKVVLDLKTKEIKRKMLLADEGDKLSKYAQKFIRAMK